jgi:hypothetical protein
MLRSISTVALVVAFLSTACEAPRGSGSASGAANAAAPAPPLVCRTERPTGSNIPRRVCYTQEELDQTILEAQDAHRRALSQPAPPRKD